ncbi:uncharacterized protein BJ171DRAFT_577449 [Polychytrium aggregatum]|uniref:uncharacterized protein n=1 Tax=Polychytrium aggregatum TaxID=110093 RepID=UPI0022FF106C|nr:uncharacterized protein BJ171DRAFT_577449 [Polychytrium aggregatum]KAI9209099.1 hypothetical protein BJ171DRAFT_577449 [Polychytrium aggregatum]
MDNSKKREKSAKQSGKGSGRPDSGSTLPTSKSGVFIFQDGSRYDGEFKELEGAVIVRHGQGTYTCGSTGCKYTGAWEMDKMHGKGKMDYPSGAVYEGMWKENRYSGAGSYYWPDNSQYSGDWENNKMHGPGRYIDKNSECWVGMFFKGTGTSLANEIRN